MFAYGGYNAGMPPVFRERVTRLMMSEWAMKGGVYVHCNLRGGNEYGPRWHEAGMLMNKRKVFEDFIGVAEQLIKDGWTKKGRIGIVGCSNGGLLMSALVTMRPDLWAVVIDSVPHTDMIHFADDDRGPMYITEYGDPGESREMFEYLLSYSPYHNVREEEYPPIYIQTGELDNNVPPYHGKKFAARMQQMNRSDAPVLLRVLAQGSHDRGQGEENYRTLAEMQVFLEHYLHMEG
jgi:prolyl oligopeptidase